MAVYSPDILASGYVTFREWRSIIELISRALGTRPPIYVDVEVPVEVNGKPMIANLGGVEDVDAEVIKLREGITVYRLGGLTVFKLGDSIYPINHRHLPRMLVNSGLLSISIRTMWKKRGDVACAEFAYRSEVPGIEPIVLTWAAATYLDMQTYATYVDTGSLDGNVLRRGDTVFSFVGIATVNGLRPVIGVVAAEPKTDELKDLIHRISFTRRGVVEIRRENMAALALRMETLAGYYTVDIPAQAIAPPRTSPRLDLWIRASPRPVFTLGVVGHGSARIFVFEDLSAKLKC